MKMDKNKSPKSVAKNYTNGHNKFELVSCPRNGKNCSKHLITINKNYSDSNLFHQNKEYHRSIEALNDAFNKTFELNESTCANCARTFRYSIIQSLKNIHLELQDMSSGFFKKNDYKSSFVLADNVLNTLSKNLD
jgi:hypothetical protein